MTLRNVPMGVSIHNVELKPGKGGEIARAASASCVIQAKQDGYAIVKMPSGGLGCACTGPVQVETWPGSSLLCTVHVCTRHKCKHMCHG